MKVTKVLLPVAALLIVACVSDGMPSGQNRPETGGGSPPANNGGGNGAGNDRDAGSRPGNGNRGNIRKSEVEKKRMGFNYLKKYYRLVTPDKTVVEGSPAENLRDGMRMLQKMAGLKETGEIDEPTARAMTWPRCGNTDNVTVQVSEEALRKKRYVVSGKDYKWNRLDLTFKINNYPDPDISMITTEEVDEAVANAFKLWSDVTPLTFTRVPESSNADIVLLFGKGKHTTVSGDPAFDGPAGTLAHAFTPNSGWGNLNGDVHYDDDENFTHKKYYGRNLLYVTAHEVGHALGLDHSTTRGALMWPFILGYTPNYQLPEDDKLGIQAIYGENPIAPPASTTESPPVTTTMPAPIYCNMTFNEVEMIRGDIFAFHGKRFWRFSNDGHLISPIEGTVTNSFFRNGPSVVNAVAERWFDEKVLITKGKKVWQMNGNVLDEGYPKLLSNFDIPKKVQCAMHRASEGITYYFKEKLVYAFDEFDEVLLNVNGTKIHKVFNGIPRGTRVTAAFTGLDGKHYLLVDKNYYVVDSEMKSDGTLFKFAQDFLRCPPV